MTEASPQEGKRVFVVYGSETSLLSPLFSRTDVNFIRIYNQTVPKKSDNCVDINQISLLKDELEKIKNTPGLEIVFIGAAFKIQNELFISEKPEDIAKSIEVNIVNYTKIAHILLPYMLKHRWGRMIYLSSFRSHVTGKGTSIYSSSKAFGEKFFEILGKEYGRAGITTTSIRMGYFDGRMTKYFDNEKIESIKGNIANNKFGEATDLVDAIDFCIANPYANSGILDLNGGLVYD